MDECVARYVYTLVLLRVISSLFSTFSLFVFLCLLFFCFVSSCRYMLIDVIFEHVRQLLGRYEEESVLFDASEKKQQKQQQATQKASGGPSSGRGSKIAVKSKGSSSSGKKSS